jgi:excisionase family DNA binding protein
MTAAKEKKQDRYLAVNRVAEILGCTERYAYEMVKDGKLRAIRLGNRAIRISEKSLQEFIKSNIVDPDEYFGFEETRNPDPDPVHSRKVVRSSWMEK